LNSTAPSAVAVLFNLEVQWNISTRIGPPRTRFKRKFWNGGH